MSVCLMSVRLVDGSHNVLVRIMTQRVGERETCPTGLVRGNMPHRVREVGNMSRRVKEEETRIGYVRLGWQ